MKPFGPMKYYHLFLILALVSCNTEEEESYVHLTDEERLKVATTLAHHTILVDGHVDLPYRMKVGGFTLQREMLDISVRSEGGNFDYPRSKEGGLDAPFMSIYIPADYQVRGGAKALADSLIMMTERVVNSWPDKFAFAYSPDDIEKNFKAGKISLPMGIENGAALEDDLENIKYFYDKGIRYITLTHGKDNLIGDSSYDTTRTHGGLSAYGKKVVEKMNKTGIMVDISHVSDATFYDVMKISSVPVIASHSSSRHFTPGFERNMDDDMVRQLGKNKGVIMINFGGSFLDGTYNERSAEVREHIINWLADNSLNRNDPEAVAYITAFTAKNNPFPDVQKVADHIDHVVALAGIDFVGLGSDFDGVGDSLPTGLKDVSMYPNLIAELLKRGYTKSDVEKICYRNIFRVWREVQAYAARGN
jgi:membrane dipeptidase